MADARKEFYDDRFRAMDHIRTFKGMSPAERLVNLQMMSMVNYKTGDCFPKQQTVADLIGVDLKTVERGISHAVRLGWWTVRVDGRSNHYIANFSAFRGGTKTDDLARCEGQKRPSSRDKNGLAARDKSGPLILIEEPSRELSPPSPPWSPQQGESSQVTIDEEEGPELTFDEFWIDCRRAGERGPALAAWNKLTSADKRAIDAVLCAGRLDLGGAWACTWITARAWERAPTLNIRVGTILAVPNSTAWEMERIRLLVAGDRDSVALMEERAREGLGWTVRVRNGGGAR